MRVQRTDAVGVLLRPRFSGARLPGMLPGRESEGAILVEYAVNLSEKAKYEGRVFFQDFYSGGWRHEPSWLQYLQSEIIVPRDEKDVWMKVRGKWRLKKLLPPLTSAYLADGE